MKKSMLQVTLIVLLLKICSSNLLQVLVQPSSSFNSGINITNCTLPSLQSEYALAKQYIRQVKRKIPESGQHFFSSLTYLFRGQRNEEAQKIILFQNINMLLYVAGAGVGLSILLFFIVQFFIRFRLTNRTSDPSSRFNIIKIILSIIGVIGLLICLGYVTVYSFAGIKQTRKIKEGLNHLGCTTNLMNQVHTANGKNYAFSDFPDIFYKTEQAISKLRLKNNRILYYSDDILKNGGVLAQLRDRAFALQKEKKQIRDDPQNQKFLQQLNKFTIVYEDLGRAQTTDFFKSFHLFGTIMKARQDLLPYKNSLLHSREVVRSSVNFVKDVVSDESIDSITQSLKFIYVFFIVVSVYILASAYYFYLRSSSNISTLVIYIIASAGLIAFIVTIALSIAVPYFVMGCEGSYHVLKDPINYKKQVQRSKILEQTKKTFDIFAPQSKFKFTSIISTRLSSFQNLAKATTQFLNQVGTGSELVKQLRNYFEKYDGQRQLEKVDRVIKGLENKNVQSIRLLQKQALQVLNLVDQNNGLFGSIQPANVAKALKRNVDSVCIPNFNRVYQTRQKMITISYAFLLSLLFIFMIKAFPKYPEEQKSYHSQTSKLDEMRKYAIEQTTENTEEQSDFDKQRQQ